MGVVAAMASPLPTWAVRPARSTHSANARRARASAYGRPARVLNTMVHCDGRGRSPARTPVAASIAAACSASVRRIQSTSPDRNRVVATAGSAITWSEMRGMRGRLGQVAGHRLQVHRDAGMQADHAVRPTAERSVREVQQRQDGRQPVGRRPWREHLPQRRHAVQQLVGIGGLVHLARVIGERRPGREPETRPGEHLFQLRDVVLEVAAGRRLFYEAGIGADGAIDLADQLVGRISGCPRGAPHDGRGARPDRHVVEDGQLGEDFRQERGIGPGEGEPDLAVVQGLERSR